MKKISGTVNTTASPVKPDIYRYHDHQLFLKDWLAYKKASQSSFSLRQLSKKAGLSAGFLPMVLSGKRPFSAKALAKLGPLLELRPSERSYLELLVTLGTSDSQEQRLEALERMKGFRSYQKFNTKETEVYQYLTRWYHVAIREMTALPGFKLDAAWIQERLRVQVPLSELKAAIEFLIENGYIEVDKIGVVKPPEKNLDCVGGVYRIALTQFHREMFTLATKSIENTPSDRRSILGHTFAIGEANFSKAQEILEEAIAKIRSLEANEKEPDSVYHLEIGLFPITRSKDK